MVNFIGDSTHAEIPISKIENFEEKLEEFSNTKKKSLLQSIILAKKIINGDVSFRNELNHPEDKVRKSNKSDKINLKLENGEKPIENNNIKIEKLYKVIYNYL
jgi:hypothetical protein